MKKVAAVICNYNKKDYVTEGIQSVTESVWRAGEAAGEWGEPGGERRI